MIGVDYIDSSAIVTGFAHTVRALNDLDINPIGFEKKKVIYHGLTIQTITGIPEVYVELYESSIVRNFQAVPVDRTKVYYMKPEDITSLDILPHKVLNDDVALAAKQASEAIFSAAFLRMSAKDQHATLRLTAEQFSAKFAPYIGTYHLINTPKYIIVPDRKTSSLIHEAVDQSAMKPEDRAVPHGVYTGSFFVESTKSPSKRFHSISDFDIGQGTPSMMFRNEIGRTTYVVPTGSISNIIAVEGL